MNCEGSHCGWLAPSKLGKIGWLHGSHWRIDRTHPLGWSWAFFLFLRRGGHPNCRMLKSCACGTHGSSLRQERVFPWVDSQWTCKIIKFPNRLNDLWRFHSGTYSLIFSINFHNKINNVECLKDASIKLNSNLSITLGPTLSSNSHFVATGSCACATTIATCMHLVISRRGNSNSKIGCYL